MRNFIVAQLAAVALAVTVPGHSNGNDPYQANRARDASECEAKEKSLIWHWEFNQDACACFFEFDIHFNPYCDDDEQFNPFHEPYANDDFCMKKSDY